MQHTRIPLTALALTVAFLFLGCASTDDEMNSKTANLSGFFVYATGAQEKTFAIGPNDMKVRCIPNLGKETFEFEAASTFGTTEGNYLRFSLIGFRGAGDFTFIYDAVKAKSTVELGLEGGYKYEFFQTVRNDSREQISSVCTMSIDEKNVGTGTQYDGQLSCAMLLADEASPDYKDVNVGVFVDMMAKFQCEYGY